MMCQYPTVNRRRGCIVPPLAAFGAYQSIAKPQLLSSPTTATGEPGIAGGAPPIDHGVDMQAAVAS
jgi:hypothetical protein